MGADAFYLFEPVSPTPQSAPVVVFLHGFAAVHPRSYVAWISHIVRRGNIVVYPVYQVDNRSPAAPYTSHAFTAVQRAYAVLESPSHVQADAEGMALVGHSIGGVIAGNLAGLAEEAGLPTPRVLLLANAADATTGPGGAFESIMDPDAYASVPDDIFVLAVVGEEDRVAGAEAARFIFATTPQVPATNKEIILLPSDYHGTPALLAMHTAPGSIDLELLVGELPPALSRPRVSPVDALDYYGYWKWLDGLMDFAWYGVHGEFALGGGSEQTFMGLWSDTTPVRPAEVIWP